MSRKVRLVTMIPTLLEGQLDAFVGMQQQGFGSPELFVLSLGIHRKGIVHDEMSHRPHSHVRKEEEEERENE